MRLFAIKLCIAILGFLTRRESRANVKERVNERAARRARNRLETLKQFEADHA